MCRKPVYRIYFYISMHTFSYILYTYYIHILAKCMSSNKAVISESPLFADGNLSNTFFFCVTTIGFSKFYLMILFLTDYGKNYI